jgi:protein-tyrosine phosphatase
MQMAMLQAGDTTRNRLVVEQAADALRAGALIVFPTETVYGIAASATSKKGIEALRVFKQRPHNQPFTLHLPDTLSISRYIDTSPALVQRVIRKLLPGPVTLVVDADDPIIRDRLNTLGLPDDARQRIYLRNTIGIRCPDLPITQQWLAAVGSPVVASSANRRGVPAPVDAEEAALAVGNAAELVINAGRSRYAKPSTIVRVRQINGLYKWTVERAGVYEERTIRKLMQRTVMMVCTGNTCRSPIAEGLAKHIASQQKGITPQDLQAAGVHIISGGTHASSGAPASAEAIQVMHEFGIDISSHRSRPITPDLINEADEIYCMTSSHRQAILTLAPHAAEKIFLLDPAGRDVDDPIGADLKGYRRTAELIRRQLAQRIKETHL